MKWNIVVAALLTLSHFWILTSPSAEPPPVPPNSFGNFQYHSDATGKEWSKTISTEKKKEISGKCVLSSDVSMALDVPCPQLPMSLMNASGKEVGQVVISDGRFTFPIEPGSDVYLRLKSEKYRMLSQKSGPFQSGDEVILRLQRIK